MSAAEKQITRIPRLDWDDDDWEELSDEVQAKIWENSRDQLVGMSRSDLDMFWDEMPEDLQEEVLEHDPDVLWLTGYLQEYVNYYDPHNPPENAAELADAEIELQLAESDVISKAQKTDEFNDVWDRFADLGIDDIDEDSLMEAIEESLRDINNYPDFEAETYDDYRWSRHIIYAPVYESVYISFDYPKEAQPRLLSMEFDQVKAAVEDLDGNHFGVIDADELWGEMSKPRYGVTIEKDLGEPLWAVYADPDWDLVAEDLARQFSDQGEQEAALPPEERIVYEFADGAYVQDLVVSELEEEGNRLRHCVGRPDMGYTRALRRGAIKILSLRTPSGRPKLTFEIKVDGAGNPTHVNQIKGKANRLPGWDRGKIREGKVKEDEVRKAKKVVEVIGLDPYDDAPDLRPGVEALRGERVSRENPVLRTFDSPYTEMDV